MEAFESMKDNGIIFNKPEGKRGSYSVTNKNSNSWIISNKSPTKMKTVTRVLKCHHPALQMKYQYLTMPC